MKDVRNLYETMIQSTATAANGGTPLISVNPTPFMTNVDTSTTSPFVPPIIVVPPMSRNISLTDVRAALDGEEVDNALDADHDPDQKDL